MMKKIKKIIYQLILPILKISKYISWLLYLKTEDEIKIVVGAGPTNYKSWFSTDIDTLDITNEKDFKKYFTKKRINKILAEHVLEHLTENELELIAHNFYKYSENDINVRIAVPDGFHTDTKYIDRVKPGGTGYGADDHKNLFNYESLSQIFEKVGFKTKLIEYWDEFGIFTTKYKNDENGYIKRSFINDDRNKNGKPNYTSLIVDFSKN
jgi:predicted SAM-dependent methyltransferase